MITPLAKNNLLYEILTIHINILWVDITTLHILCSVIYLLSSKYDHERMCISIRGQYMFRKQQYTPPDGAPSLIDTLSTV